MQGDQQESVNAYRLALVLAIATLSFWAFGHKLYSALLPGLSSGLSLSPTDTGIARAAVVIGYFLMALPAAFISRNFGYKVGMLFGLGTLAVGMFLFHPAVENKSVAYIVMAATVIGSGLAIIEFTVAPLVVALGPKKSAILRMNIAHFFSALGIVIGAVISERILHDALGKTGSMLGQSLLMPMASVGVVAIGLAFFLEIANFPAVASARVAPNDSTWASFRLPLKSPRFRLGVLAQFFALFAQVSIAGYAVRYSLTVMPGWTSQIAEAWLSYAMLGFVVGRFVSCIAMVWVEPMRLLVVFSLGGMICAGISLFASGMIGVYGIVAASFFIAMQFPTIFAHTIRDLGDMAKSATSIVMFAAFSGTGLIGLVVYVLTAHAVRLTLIVPLLCCAGIVACVSAMRRYGQP
ncbi:MAG: MFS transporter [Rhizomicrobium sp.]|nr:MFS transporter [Rhizomicrobium sp.]